MILLGVFLCPNWTIRRSYGPSWEHCQWISIKWTGTGQLVVTHRRARGNRSCSQTVTRSAHCVDESLRRVNIDLSAQVVDIDVDYVGQSIGRELPNMMDDRRPRHILAGVEHEVFEQSEFFGGEFDRAAAATYHSPYAIQFQIQAAQDGLKRETAPAQQRPHASGELGKSERLGQIIVSAGIEAVHAVFHARASREDQHGQMRSGAAYLPKNFHSADIRQIQIQNDQITLARFHHLGDLAACRGNPNIIVFAPSNQDETWIGLVYTIAIWPPIAKPARSRAQFSIQEAFSYFDPVGICSFLHPVCFPRASIFLFGSESAQCNKPIAGS